MNKQAVTEENVFTQPKMEILEGDTTTSDEPDWDKEFNFNVNTNKSGPLDIDESLSLDDFNSFEDADVTNITKVTNAKDVIVKTVTPLQAMCLTGTKNSMSIRIRVDPLDIVESLLLDDFNSFEDTDVTSITKVTNAKDVTVKQ